MANDELTTMDRLTTGHAAKDRDSRCGIQSSFPRIVLLLVALLVFGACQKRLSKANVDEVATGMSRKQVESILGSPTSIDSTDLLITKKVTYVYRQGNESVTIVFFNDQVSAKESNLRDD